MVHAQSRKNAQMACSVSRLLTRHHPTSFCRRQPIFWVGASASGALTKSANKSCASKHVARFVWWTMQRPALTSALVLTSSCLASVTWGASNRGCCANLRSNAPLMVTLQRPKTKPHSQAHHLRFCLLQHRFRLVLGRCLFARCWVQQ